MASNLHPVAIRPVILKELPTGSDQRCLCKFHNNYITKLICLYRKNLDSGKTYILKESTGQRIRCDSRGVPIKPFDPRITGRYNFDERIQAIKKSKADLSPVSVPVQLKLNLKRNYVPQQ